jgi:orotate phosphoribosyltransferase
LTFDQAKAELLALTRGKSVSYGDFILASGARSNYYIDCRLTTLDGRGAWLVGQVMHHLIREQAAAMGLKIDAVGGLTMGADPISLAVAMRSAYLGESPLLRAFVVRKAPKTHGQTKLIEGNFRQGDTVVVIEDVTTTGESALKAVTAVQNEGGTVAFVAVLVDRQQGGRERIEQQGLKMVAAFTRDELLAS